MFNNSAIYKKTSYVLVCMFLNCGLLSNYIAVVWNQNGKDCIRILEMGIKQGLEKITSETTYRIIMVTK
jgi:hypothetical protein